MLEWDLIWYRLNDSLPVYSWNALSVATALSLHLSNSDHFTSMKPATPNTLCFFCFFCPGTRRGGTASAPRSPSVKCSCVDLEPDSSHSQWPWLSSTRSSLRRSRSTECRAHTHPHKTPEALKRHWTIRLSCSLQVNKPPVIFRRAVVTFPLYEK